MINIYIQIPYYNRHITPIFDELSQFSGLDVKVGLLNNGSAYRSGYDWDMDIDSSIYIKLWNLKDNEKQELFNNADTIAVHGFFSYMENLKLVFRGIRENKKVWIFSEGLKKKSIFNQILKAIVIKFINSNNVTFFEIGDSAYEDYLKLGANKWKYEKFAYAVAPISRENSYHELKLKLIYVGQLIERKRPLDLVLLMKELTEYDVRLTIVGDGQLYQKIVNEVKIANLGNVVDFVGLKNKEEVENLLLHHDVLILPSQYDGWGAVINEAMECGCSVICSTGCRARNIINIEMVYETGNILALKDRVLSHIDSRTRSKLKSNAKHKIKSFRPIALANILNNKLLEK